MIGWTQDVYAWFPLRFLIGLVTNPLYVLSETWIIALAPPAPGWATPTRGDRQGVKRPSAREFGRFAEIESRSARRAASLWPSSDAGSRAASAVVLSAEE